MSGGLPPASPWRYPVLVSGDTATSLRDLRPRIAATYERVRILEVPVVAARTFAELVGKSGGAAGFSAEPTIRRGPAPLANAWGAGASSWLRDAAERVRGTNPDMSASIIHSLDAHLSGRPNEWQCGRHSLSTRDRPLVMGILNVTPDSFSDAGQYLDPGRAEEIACSMVEDGADIVDVGGESTRPGSAPIGAEEEIARIIPVLKRLAGKLTVPISVDTYRASVARAALDHGASVINDITALGGDREMLPLLQSTEAGIVLMHMQGTPATMQARPHYTDLVAEIYLFLHSRVRDCVRAGIAPCRICVDPGIGFGKTIRHNLDLLRRTGEFTSLGLPVMIGPSRKGFIGDILNQPVSRRLEGTIAASVIACMGGAAVLRVHDVGPVVRAVRVAAAVMDSSTFADRERSE